MGETEYQHHLGLLNRNEDYEKILYAEQKRIYALVSELTKEESITKLLALKYDYHNKLQLKKYSKKLRKHVLFVETKKNLGRNVVKGRK